MAFRHKITLHEITFIHKNYMVMSRAEMARQLGISAVIIRNRMKLWKLIVPDEVKAEFNKIGRFKKGSVPKNKGVKLTEEQKEKSKHTWFKKGNKPGNTKSGPLHISIRYDNRGKPYKHIKIMDGQWELLHVFNWHKEYGVIPIGYVVILKDGDSLNCKPENLKCISKAENLKRNRQAYLDLPEELRTSVRLMNKVKKSIKH